MLVFAFDQTSFSEWVIALISYQRQYLPVFSFLIILSFVIFLILKALAQWKASPQPRNSGPRRYLVRDLLAPLVIRIHKGLLVFILGLVAIFLIRSVYLYFYRVDLPFLRPVFLLTRFAFVFGILYLYFFLGVAIPLIRKGHSFQRAQQYFNLLFFSHWKKTLLQLVVQILWIVLSVFALEIVINSILRLPVLYADPQAHSPFLHFSETKTIGQCVAMTFLFLLGVLISNLLYCPFVLITKKGFKLLNLELG